MFKKNLKKSIIAASFLALLLPILAFATQVRAAAPVIDVGLDQINDSIALGHQDPRVIVSNIINTALMFLGIIAVVIILYAGFKWMTSGGNEKGVAEAQKLMSGGVIGLVIILASWGIARFILTQLLNATNNG